jgi:RimJ/RimL family protein N-acetyltransferase
MLPFAQRSAAVATWLLAHAEDAVRLRLARPSDAAFILSLRTDEQLSVHLSKVTNDVAAQRAWLEAYAQRETEGAEFYFIILHEGAAVGTLRLYDARDDSFQWGSWVIQRGTAPRVALRSVALVYDLGFRSLGFAHSHFETRRDNLSVKRFHLRCGAEITGEDEHHYFYRISREEALKSCPLA